MPVPFKIYAGFECNLKSVESDKVLTHKLVCVDDEFTKPIFVFRGKNAAYKFVEAILKDFGYCKKIKKKYFSKKLIMSEEEEQFQLSNTHLLHL